MAKSPLILAALATEALPHLRFKQARPLTAAASGSFDSALLTDDAENSYVVRMAANQSASAELAVELSAIRAIGASDRDRLGFEIPICLGETADIKGNRVYVFNFISGDSTEITSVGPGTELSGSIATAIASIHRISPAAIDDAGLPNISANEQISLRIAELDRIAATGQVPVKLLTRWEAALEDTSLFGYRPTVIHGSLNGEVMLNDGRVVTGVLGWASLRISDPAEDFAWILGAGLHNLSDDIVGAYERLTGYVDDGLKIRATLYSEIELARWLMHGLNRQDQSIVADAQALLTLLAEEVEAGAVASLSKTVPAIGAASFGSSLIEPDLADQTLSEPSYDDELISEPAEMLETAAIELPEQSNSPTKPELVLEEDIKTRPIELPERSDNELF